MATDSIAVLTRLDIVGPALLQAAATDPRCCILATVVTLSVARHFGLTARPWACDFIAANAPTAHALNRGLTPAMAVQEPGAFSIGTVGKPVGHLVAVVESRWLVDLALTPWSRPAHGLVLPAGLLLDTQDLTTPLSHIDGLCLSRPDGTQWRYLPTPERMLWRRSVAWQNRHSATTRRLIGAVLRAMRKHSRPSPSLATVRLPAEA